MKWVGLFLVALLLSPPLFAEISPGRPDPMVELDTATSNITTGYDGANAKVVSGLASPGNFQVWNETGSLIGVSVPNGNNCLVSSPDNFVVPGLGVGSGNTVPNVAVNKILCMRSLTGASITSGKVYISTW